jgi:hypothetical protein
MRVEGCLLGKVEDFALVVSRPLRGAQVGGMRSRHLEMSRLQSKAGSSLALPAVRRARQSSLSAALLSRPCEEAKPLEQGAGLESKARKRVGQWGNFDHVEYVVHENMVVDFGDIARLAVATVALWPRRSVSQVAKIQS